MHGTMNIKLLFRGNVSDYDLILTVINEQDLYAIQCFCSGVDWNSRCL